jgi:hypothetical protein
MNDGITLDQKLESELRNCSKCGYEIQNPLTDRCPRCFEYVERIETNCGSCTHQGNCEFVHLYAENKQVKKK